MIKLTISERLKIYTRYIGQMMILKRRDLASGEQIVRLTGVNTTAVQVTAQHNSRWIPLYDDFEIYEIQLLLKPLRLLTDQIKERANSLPVQNFITQYYIQLGFDMPVFIEPGHPANCKYAHELGLAVYSEEYSHTLVAM